MLQYHFDMGKIKPYVGAGVNYTVFFDNTNGLKTNNAWGGAVQVGVDYQIKGNWFANVDFKKLWVGTDFSVSGTPPGPPRYRSDHRGRGHRLSLRHGLYAAEVDG